MRRLGVLIILALLITALSPGVTGTNVTGKVSVEINPPNSELLSIVYYLAFGRNDPFIIERGGYLDDVDRYFGPYRNHPAVGMLRDYLGGNSESVSERDMRLYYLEDELLLCTKPPELNPGGENIGGDRWTLDFIRALRDFAERSHFMEFYESHRGGYYDEDLRIYEGALSLLPPLMSSWGPYLDLSNVRFEFKHPPFLVAVHGHSFNPVKDGVQVYGAGGMVPLVRRDAQRTLWSYRTARDTMFGLPLNRDYLNNTGLDRLIYLSFVYHELGHDVTVPRPRFLRENALPAVPRGHHRGAHALSREVRLTLLVGRHDDIRGGVRGRLGGLCPLQR